MKQELLEIENRLDDAGNPTGGRVFAHGISIFWQDGPLGRGADRQPPNGAFVEGVIEAAAQRLRFYQGAAGGKFACEENAAAIRHLENALAFLEKRTIARAARQVEGTHQP